MLPRTSLLVRSSANSIFRFTSKATTTTTTTSSSISSTAFLISSARYYVSVSSSSSCFPSTTTRSPSTALSCSSFLILQKRGMYLPPRQKPPDPKDQLIINYRSNVIFIGLALLVSVLFVFTVAFTMLANRLRSDETQTRKGKKILILGGGAAGSMAASALATLDSDINITVIEKKRVQMFTPVVPLAAAGHRSYDLRAKGPSTLFASTMWTVTREAGLVIADVVDIDPVKKRVTDDKGEVYDYDVLVLATGAEQDHEIVGGFFAVDQDRIAVSPGGIRDNLLSTATGNVLIARAPAKTKLHRSSEGNWVSLVNTCWKHLHFFGRTGVPGFSIVHALTPDSTINDALPEAHKNQLDEFWKERNIQLHTGRELVKVDRVQKIATFRYLDEKTKKEVLQEIPFRLLIVDLPVKPSDLLRQMAKKVFSYSSLVNSNSSSSSNSSSPNSSDPLAAAPEHLEQVKKMTPEELRKQRAFTNQDGFITVHSDTLQHTQFPDVFAIGDCTDLPVAKSYGALTTQAPVLAHNILQYLKKREQNAKYDLFSSFHINMSTWRVMWPEVIGNEGKRCEPRRGYWDDSDWKYWKGFLSGVFFQLWLYEFHFWFLQLRSHWCAPHWFSFPIYPEGKLLLDDEEEEIKRSLEQELEEAKKV